MTGNEILQHRIKKAQELAKSVIATADSTKSFLGKPTILGTPSDSTKKDRAKKKRERQNRKKGRR
jgi:hypothetical protein